MSRLIVLLLVMVMSGCASFTEEHSRTLLMDRSTGERKECTVDMMRSKESYDKYKACIEKYEAEGYKIWSQY